MQNMPTATELAIKYAKREQLRIIIDKALLLTINFTVPFMIDSLIFLAVLVKSSVNLNLRMISDFSIREIYHANGWG